jgi:cytochrome c556
MRKKLALAVVATFAVAGLAQAQVADPIAIRQAGQDLLAGDFDGIRAVVAAKGDVTKLQNPAKAMARWIRTFPSQFPPGSDKGSTKALPAVWSDHAGFEKAANVLADAADKLAEDAKAGNAEAVATQVKVVADACGACHRTYRAR